MNFKNKSKTYMLEHLKKSYCSPTSPIAYMGVDKIYIYFEKTNYKREIKEIISNNETYSPLKKEKNNPCKIYTPIFAFDF